MRNLPFLDQAMAKLLEAVVNPEPAMMDLFFRYQNALQAAEKIICPTFKAKITVQAANLFLGYVDLERTGCGPIAPTATRP